jgi:hypothetical protein
MNFVVSLSVPRDRVVSEVWVSESAQGPLIGRLQSYLDPRSLFCEKKAGESALAYSFSTGSIDPLSKGHTFRHQVKGRITYQQLSTPRIMVDSQIKLISSRCACWGTESLTLDQSRSLTPNREEIPRERRCGWRLMTPASRSTRGRPWILVAEKPTDEALRQGRNPSTSNKKFKGHRRKSTTHCTTLYQTIPRKVYEIKSVVRLGLWKGFLADQFGCRQAPTLEPISAYD